MSCRTSSLSSIRLMGVEFDAEVPNISYCAVTVEVRLRREGQLGLGTRAATGTRRKWATRETPMSDKSHFTFRWDTDPVPGDPLAVQGKAMPRSQEPLSRRRATMRRPVRKPETTAAVTRERKIKINDKSLEARTVDKVRGINCACGSSISLTPTPKVPSKFRFPWWACRGKVTACQGSIRPCLVSMGLAVRQRLCLDGSVSELKRLLHFVGASMKPQ